jgi:integrase
LDLHPDIGAAGIPEDRKDFLFRTLRGHWGIELSEKTTEEPYAWRMIGRRAVAVGVHAPVDNHSFRAIGITACLSNGGALKYAQETAAHESSRATKLYDRTKEPLTQDEVERIRL